MDFFSRSRRSKPMLMGAVLMLLLPAFAAVADAPPDQKHEIAHLLSFVRYADCDLIRNGAVHDSKDGYRHLLDKYDYFRSRIRSAEDFIDLAATKSLLSGRAYMVDCGEDDPIPSATWLRRELARYRSCVASSTGPCDRGGESNHSRR